MFFLKYTVTMIRGPLPSVTFDPEPEQRARSRVSALCDLHSLSLAEVQETDNAFIIDASARYAKAKAG